MDHSFSIQHAKKYGVESAIIIKNLQFWIMKNRANNKHLYDGRTWTYNSVKAFSELFPYWTEKQIRRILEKLEENGVLMSGNYNKSAYDRTKWFAFVDESIFLYEEFHLTKRANEFDQTGEPIPDNNTYIKPDKKQYNTKPPTAESEDKNMLPNPFKEFWQSYPRKKGRAMAEKKFPSLYKKHGAELFKALQNYCAEVISNNTEQRFIMHASTFLNGRWMDYLDGYEKKKVDHKNDDSVDESWEADDIIFD